MQAKHKHKKKYVWTGTTQTQACSACLACVYAYANGLPPRPNASVSFSFLLLLARGKVHYFLNSKLMFHMRVTGRRGDFKIWVNWRNVFYPSLIITYVFCTNCKVGGLRTNDKLILQFHALRVSNFRSFRLEGFTCAFIVAFFDLIRRIYVEKKKAWLGIMHSNQTSIVNDGYEKEKRICDCSHRITCSI